MLLHFTTCILEHSLTVNKRTRLWLINKMPNKVKNVNFYSALTRFVVEVFGHRFIVSPGSGGSSQELATPQSGTFWWTWITSARVDDHDVRCSTTE